MFRTVSEAGHSCLNERYNEYQNTEFRNLWILPYISDYKDKDLSDNFFEELLSSNSSTAPHESGIEDCVRDSIDEVARLADRGSNIDNEQEKNKQWSRAQPCPNITDYIQRRMEIYSLESLLRESNKLGLLNSHPLAPPTAITVNSASGDQMLKMTPGQDQPLSSLQTRCIATLFLNKQFYAREWREREHMEQIKRPGLSDPISSLLLGLPAQTLELTESFPETVRASKLSIYDQLTDSLEESEGDDEEKDKEEDDMPAEIDL
ncbi:uncharacterized protein BT62DRAFT_924847 [Guyanagaster necrorhizus]|uniref:Uncharacterized protein n=1 Tax=Guyanagaster necrorhizus TaxID=856835 RepID=A0A9P8AL39_9AGAR|nr:uncharacterized protein BT62DRAFT_924847 [Guyanagaster necrorhizus MCA 3950]KAG7439221.1 hypothetical protein BT62DRAFT_924847 [Guyanagaster necrorhizus MCA 3950]